MIFVFLFWFGHAPTVKGFLALWCWWLLWCFL